VCESSTRAQPGQQQQQQQHNMVVVKHIPPPPRLGLGMAALGRPGYINLDRSSIFGASAAAAVDNDNQNGRHGGRSVEVMQAAANSVMDTLFALNKNSSQQRPWLDCARSYGLAEQFVGEYLDQNNINPKDVYVSSKWGYTYVADWQVSLMEPDAPHEVKDHSTANFMKQVQETSTLIGKYLDLYQIHSATLDSGILTDTSAHVALTKCRHEHGWAIGLSVSGPRQDEIIRMAIQIRVPAALVDNDGNDDNDERSSPVEHVALFDSVQCTYNVMEQRPAAALKEAADAGLSIIIKEGLANGRALQHAPILRYAAQLDCQPDQLALGCILAAGQQDGADYSVLSGAVTSAQLESNWKALQVAETLGSDPNLLQEILQASVVKSEDYWQERAALAWN
jgi:aryl-alcohol dehydrogenase-like predicted oxidoreductase